MAKNVKSKIIISEASLKKINAIAQVALRNTAETLQGDIKNAQVMPRDTGEMQGTSHIIDDSDISEGIVRVVANTPYARRLYYHPEYNFHRKDWVDEKGKRHGSNPNARGKWLEPWLPGGEYESDAAEYFEEFLKKLMR